MAGVAKGFFVGGKKRGRRLIRKGGEIFLRWFLRKNHEKGGEKDLRKEVFQKVLNIRDQRPMRTLSV